MLQRTYCLLRGACPACSLGPLLGRSGRGLSLVLALVLFGWPAAAQEADSAAADTSQAVYTSKGVQRILRKAHGYLRYNQYRELIRYLQEELPQAPAHPELNRLMGKAHYAIGRKLAARAYYHTALRSLARSGQRMPTPALDAYADCLHLAGALDSARTLYQRLQSRYKSDTTDAAGAQQALAHIQHRLAQLDNAQRLRQDSAGGVRVQNLGPPLNTPHPDFAPVIRADGEVMLFTSMRPGNLGGVDHEGIFFEDIYRTELQEDSTWSEPDNLGEPVNTRTHDATIGLRADGQTLLLFRYRDRGDILVSQLTGDTWSDPEPLPGRVNSKARETSAFISPDGNRLFFTREREDRETGLDLYLARRDSATGTWGRGRPLSPRLNTPYNEAAPFLHPDGKTLYFASKGHNSMGDYDIFVSTFNAADSSWSPPRNLQPPVNSTGEDNFFVLSADGRRGYFASQRPGGQGELDLYAAYFPPPQPFEVIAQRKLPPEHRFFDPGPDSLAPQLLQPAAMAPPPAPAPLPSAQVQQTADPASASPPGTPTPATPDTAAQAPSAAAAPGADTTQTDTSAPAGTQAQVTVLKGRVEDALTGAPIGASLRVVNLDTGQPYKALSSNPATGRYLITLPSGHAYSLRVQAEGYLFYSEHIEVPEGQGYRERELDIPLALIVEGQQTTLNNIFFRVGSAELLAKSRRELNSLARMLQNNPQLKLAVAGHTDNQGDQQLNQRLSRQRAEAVVDFLVRQGIARKRLKAKGYGQRQPIASNASPAGRARNRRVTIRVLQAE